MALLTDLKFNYHKCVKKYLISFGKAILNVD